MKVTYAATLCLQHWAADFLRGGAMQSERSQVTTPEVMERIHLLSREAVEVLWRETASSLASNDWLGM